MTFPRLSSVAARLSFLGKLINSNNAAAAGCRDPRLMASCHALQRALTVCAANQYSTFPSTDRQFYVTCHPGANDCKGGRMHSAHNVHARAHVAMHVQVWRKWWQQS